MFEYDIESSDLLLTKNAICDHQEAVRHITASLPHNFYDRSERTVSLVGWLPWPGNSVEFVHDDEFEFYGQTADAERVPSITSYHGHRMLMPVVRVEYLGRSRKFLKCKVSFVRRFWDAENKCSAEQVWLTVAAVQGDNNHIRLLEELPGETDLDLDQSVFFTETPEEMELDFELRLKRAYGDVLTELI